MHNLIYVYSPNWFSNSSEYLKNYPGDACVDILGIDIYDFKNGKFLQNALSNLNFVENIAREKNMLFALSETGLENITENNWWTDLGHPSENNFKEFVDKDFILLNQEMQF
ncbi:glycosyl hydrolase [Zobellia laminariae]|uniref:glycosyl hydrolase n=1 Tax=Zobellia laminariae TaxID=248906 RepID=UPI0016A77633|nr:hypothetical protein [Zobellia laminariae]